MQTDFTFTDLKRILADCRVTGDENQIRFSNAKPVTEANENSITWISSKKNNARELFESTLASVVICDEKFKYEGNIKNKILVKVPEPRLAFIRIVAELFQPKVKYGIHPSAVIHQSAQIHPNVFIGANTYIGKSIIGEGCVIYGNCYIYDKVEIGKNVIIHAGAVIGADGYGYERNEKGELEKFPHIGGVCIDDDVEIGANTCIDRGTLGNTHIKTGTKIDNLVHIAHNVVIGKHTTVIALSMIGGGTVIGDYAWVAPAAVLRNKITVHDKATVGMGAVVTKDIPQGETWLGNPAMEISKFKSGKKKPE